MGQEIAHSHFRKHDFMEFDQRLRKETALLGDVFRDRAFGETHPVAGFEVEAWLVDRNGLAIPDNPRFLDAVHSDLVTPELARFNVELNGMPLALAGKALSEMQNELECTWTRCQQVAWQELDGCLLAIGILPTVREQSLVLENMSTMTRYRALNESVRRMRKGEPIKLEIQGRELLRTWHEDVMLESAATSYQLHLQVPQNQALRAYNAAIILSAPMVAISANSPYLFAHDLWDETRIPVFEQAVSVNTEDYAPRQRVTFGSGYANNSLFECFEENLAEYPILLPEHLGDNTGEFRHLRLHNGTVWRWNRPLIGFDREGVPHLRIEHRVMAAGPTIVDMFANAALFYGLAQSFMTMPAPPESRIPFSHARTNFYRAARDGLDSRLRWFDGHEISAPELLRALIPLAREGMHQLDMDHADIELYLGIIEDRLATGQNGCAWQRQYVSRHGLDMAALTLAYMERQKQGSPVHEWTI
ncbi:MAG: glutamate--cysteine ligase [Gammaproteobacteria bacterium]|nr:glutamate--cysteine ligase [Gammaproteobacteria bacterium]